MQKSKLLICLLLTFFIIFSMTLPCFCTDSSYVWSNNAKPLNNNKTVTTSTSSKEENSNNSLNLESPSAILIEQTSGQVLYEHNSHEKLRPASVTKIMSILLIMEAIDER